MEYITARLNPPKEVVNEIDLNPDQVQVENDEGWGMQIEPKFGCIHWELKGENNA